MKLEKIERLITLLRNNGVSHFKADGIEIQVNLAMTTAKVETSTHSQLKEKAPPLQAVPPKEIEIPHHVNEVASLLKLNDEALVDKLFPDYSQMEAKKA